MRYHCSINVHDLKIPNRLIIVCFRHLHPVLIHLSVLHVIR
jgi:hypothetical protein